jgi:spore germination protein YaaH
MIDTIPAEKQAIIGCRKQREASAPTEKQQQVIMHQTKNSSTDKLFQYVGTPIGRKKPSTALRNTAMTRHHNSQQQGTANLDVTIAMRWTPLSAKNRNRPLA